MNPPHIGRCSGIIKDYITVVMSRQDGKMDPRFRDALSVGGTRKQRNSYSKNSVSEPFSYVRENVREKIISLRDYSPSSSSTDHIIHQSYYHHHAPSLVSTSSPSRLSCNCRHFLPILPYSRSLPNRGLISRLQLGRPIVCHTQGGRKRIRGQSNRWLSRLREAPPTT